MLYVFLDVDGVLNNAHTKGIRNKLWWLDDENIAVFTEFIEECWKKYGRENTRIILTSSWRRNNFSSHYDGIEKFLRERLSKNNLTIYDETESIDVWARGYEIADYLLRHKDDVSHYVVIDDVLFVDFKPLSLTSHWVQTSDDPKNGMGGLRKKHLKHLFEKASKPVTNKDFEKLSRQPLRND
ncbi:hypothetical protein SAMN02910384_03190 [Pseudobutyrivibrio sp. ACV-2]|uniref:HAD domain-containing protein n=1 Tax=Pseudobutyrivibrio sp. ACV-2 TaxID=1520801 RepID=UPI00089BA91F|nr:HAD domain-containing protein [Pseudobutyrivibrio sp. ACV-2]SEB04366.1 hypothetical protein SAMN02910384_03190 [Pseudobutyrivibrio sp. ACV-2]